MFEDKHLGTGKQDGGRPRAFLAIVAGLWMALAVAESVHRFDPFIHPPGRDPDGEPTPYRRLVHRRLVGDAGGDLTRMLGFRAGAGLFAVPRDDIDVWTDRRGYRNAPGLADTWCPVIVTGDSYMDQGVTNEATPAGQLSRLLGVPVYDHTRMASGPAEGAFEFLASEEFRKEPPKVLVWGFVERSVDGGRFPTWPPSPPGPRPEPRSLAERLERLRKGVDAVPEEIKAYLTRWSMVKRWAVNIRSEAVYRLSGELLPEARDKVLVGERPGGFVLFFAPGVRGLGHTAGERRLGRVVESIGSVAAECERRGIHLVVVLVPDKGHVYRRWLRPEDRPRLPEPDALTDLAARLGARKIHAVSLLPIFQARSGDGQPLLYYPDDTHWSEEGIRVAMEAVAASLRERGIDLGRRGQRGDF